jgi:hypothetical protein
VFYNEQCLASSFSINLTETLRVLPTFTVLQNADWARLENSIGSVFDSCYEDNKGRSSLKN